MVRKSSGLIGAYLSGINPRKSLWESPKSPTKKKKSKKNGLTKEQKASLAVKKLSSYKKKDTKKASKLIRKQLSSGKSIRVTAEGVKFR